jgi:hypothetical protein
MYSGKIAVPPGGGGIGVIIIIMETWSEILEKYLIQQLMNSGINYLERSSCSFLHS